MESKTSYSKQFKYLKFFRGLAFFLLVLDLIFQVIMKGFYWILLDKVKFLNSWALTFAIVYFYWVLTFEPGPSRKYSWLVKDLQALNLSLLTSVTAVYWLSLHRIHEDEDSYTVFRKYSQHLIPFLLCTIEFFLNDIPVRNSNGRIILPVVLLYLVSNLYFSITEGQPVYSIITWTDKITPFIFLGCLIIFYGAFYFWVYINKLLRKKAKKI